MSKQVKKELIYRDSTSSTHLTNVYQINDGEKFRVEDIYDYKPLLESNWLKRKHSGKKIERNGGIHVKGELPLDVFLNLVESGVIDTAGKMDKKELNKWMNRPENAVWKTTMCEW